MGVITGCLQVKEYILNFRVVSELPIVMHLGDLIQSR